MVKVFSLDLSLNHTGFCVMEDNNSKTIRSGVIEIKKFVSNEDRISQILNSLIDIYNEENLDFKAIIIEDFAFGARGRAIFDLGELAGVVKYYFASEKASHSLSSSNSTQYFL